ncbi:MAG: hypothetical protein R3F59_30655 [Myxococcota bacterium]
MRLLALCALSVPALAADAPAPTPADCAALTSDAKATCELNVQLTTARTDLAGLGDCAKAEGDAKASCEVKKAELELKITQLTAQLEPPKDVKGGKATRSNTNRMEAEASDE